MSPPETLAALTRAIEDGKGADARRLAQEAIAAGAAAQAILDAMQAGMDDVGRRFQCAEIFMPQMLLAGRAMKDALALLEPLLVRAGIEPRLTAVIGTVQGDLHDIGKNLVAMMWRGARVAVVDLGTNVSAEAFVTAARQHRAQVVGLSALLTTTMPAMRTVVAALRAAELGPVQVLVGGAPVTHEFAREIGADGFAPDAAGAAELVRKLVPA